MGKAKKNNKKKVKTPPPLHQLLREDLDRAKRFKSDERAQDVLLDLLDTIIIIKNKDPDVFLYSNYKSEVPITLLLILGRYLDSPELRQNTRAVLFSLLSTACCDAVFKLGGSKYLVEFVGECLEPEDEEVQERVFDTLYNLRGRTLSTSPYDLLGKAGCHMSIIKVMKEFPSNSNISSGGEEILASLVEFCSDQNRKCTLLTETIDEVLASVDNSEANISLASSFCHALASVMAQNQFSIPFVKNVDGPRRVLAMMERHPENPFIQTSGCWFLASFVFDEEFQSDCFQAVMAALKLCCDDVRTRRCGMSCINKMMKMENSSSLVLQSGHVPFLLEKMKQHKEVEVQSAGCAVLRSLTYRVEENEPVTDKEAAHLLAFSLKIPVTTFVEKNLWIDCALALGNLLMKADKEIVLDIFLKEDCYSNIATAMEFARKYRDKWATEYHDYKDIKVCTIIREMASSKRNEIKLAIASSGCTDLIIDCMKQNPGDKAIQSVSCHALGLVTINKDPRIFEAISKVDGVNIILDAVDRFPKEEVIFNFGGSAAILTREYEDDKKYGKLDFQLY